MHPLLSSNEQQVEDRFQRNLTICSMLAERLKLLLPPRCTVTVSPSVSAASIGVIELKQTDIHINLRLRLTAEEVQLHGWVGNWRTQFAASLADPDCFDRACVVLQQKLAKQQPSH